MASYPIPIPAWFWIWARWYLGRSEYKGHARDPQLRPANAPKRIPAWAWKELLRRFVNPTPAPAPPPLPPLEDLGRNVLFTAWNPEAALRATAKWKIALSADPAYDAAARAAAPKIKQAGHLLSVWGNQSQVGANRILAFAAAIGADYTIMQAETPAEYESAKAAGAKLVVGNPNSWTDSQRADATERANAGDVAFMFEVYSNMDGTWPDVASSRNVPIVTEVLGVGGWEDRPDVQLVDYSHRTPAGVWATMSVYLAEDMTDASWSILP